MNITLACLQAIRKIPNVMHSLKMWHRCGTRRCSGKISNVPSDLNGFKVLIVHLIFDWLITCLAGFQFPLFVMHTFMPRFCWPCPAPWSSISFESEKLNLNSSFRAYFPVWVYWLSGSLMALTLLVACFAMISLL
jgi:hypothetical protein